MGPSIRTGPWFIRFISASAQVTNPHSALRAFLSLETT
ncbi:hypothetical protein SBD_6487 [Streptomyces bottropensis ATCC 25435]|uniref:Uncharacterized protein n=1 Tax=Streptomyces bottropensis ATCC 25435 TaxID=1054862 RepID=M3E778_9ACTN|nr:hypothetical protein SBD_6487 [Streptomyces bottropensis ATCC 25435]